MASFAATTLAMQERPSSKRRRRLGEGALGTWWLATPRNRNPGVSATLRASATASGTVRTPPRPIIVSTSTTTPSVAPTKCAARASRSTCSGASTAKVTSMRLANAARRLSFAASTTWLASSTLPAPALAKTSASETLAAQTPPTVPPAATCMARICGDLWFLPWGRRRIVLSR